MMSRLTRFVLAAGLIAGNATLASALTADNAAKGGAYDICQWQCGHNGGWAQGCEAWLFTSCGEDRCGTKPTDGCGET